MDTMQDILVLAIVFAGLIAISAILLAVGMWMFWKSSRIFQNNIDRGWNLHRDICEQLSAAASPEAYAQIQARKERELRREEAHKRRQQGSVKHAVEEDDGND